MKKRTAGLIAVAVLLTSSTTAFAAYTRATSAPLQIYTIYANEWGSPFVRFHGTVNAACSSGNGLYLYNQEITTVNDEIRDRRKNKMAILVAAKMAGKRVVLDYYYDPSKTEWDGCYIHGIEVVD